MAETNDQTHRSHNEPAPIRARTGARQALP